MPVKPVPDTDGYAAICGWLPQQLQELLTPPLQLPPVWPADIIVSPLLHFTSAIHSCHRTRVQSEERDKVQRAVTETARELPNVISWFAEKGEEYRKSQFKKPLWVLKSACPEIIPAFYLSPQQTRTHAEQCLLQKRICLVSQTELKWHLPFIFFACWHLLIYRKSMSAESWMGESLTGIYYSDP